VEEFDKRVYEARQELTALERITIQNGDANKIPRFDIY
jgi:hypothetical protein